LDFPSFYLINEGRRQIGEMHAMMNALHSKDLDLHKLIAPLTAAYWIFRIKPPKNKNML